MAGGGRRDAPLHPLAMSPKYLAILATGILREVGAGERRGASENVSTPARALVAEARGGRLDFAARAIIPEGKITPGFPSRDARGVGRGSRDRARTLSR